jgi:hypothetical protein
MVFPTLVWVKIVANRPEVPSFVRRGGVEVEAWSGNTWSPPCNSRPMARLYPTLILACSIPQGAPVAYKGEEACRTAFWIKLGESTPKENPEAPQN